MREYTLHAWPFTATVRMEGKTGDVRIEVTNEVDLALDSHFGREYHPVTHIAPERIGREYAARVLRDLWKNYFELALEQREGSRKRQHKEEYAEISRKLAAPFTYEIRETFTLEDEPSTNEADEKAAPLFFSGRSALFPFEMILLDAVRHAECADRATERLFHQCLKELDRIPLQDIRTKDGSTKAAAIIQEAAQKTEDQGVRFRLHLEKRLQEVLNRSSFATDAKLPAQDNTGGR